MRHSTHSNFNSKLTEQNQKKRYSSLHKAVQQYRLLSYQLGYKMFESTTKTKKETNILFKMRNSVKINENSLYRQQFVNRKQRRQNLGLQQADIQNYENKIYGKNISLIKRRKIYSTHKNKNFQVCQHVKRKYNIKGFAAKIQHNLGKRKQGILGLTKMINTDLFKN